MKIGLISCVKTKCKYRTEAKNMYLSPLFKGYYNIAKRNCDLIYILSAKYGLLKENDIIEPYEESLNNKTEYQRKLWSYNVFREIEKNIKKDDIIYWYAGMNYKKYLSKILINKQIHYSKNLGIGKILKKLKNESINSI